MKNIHLLPTDKPSKLFIHNAFNDLRFDVEQLKHDNNQHIYITSDEEIKEGDWVYHKLLKSIFKIDLKEVSQEYIEERKNILKVILTTDQDLIKDSVQAIDDEFLEWFVKNPSCEEVEIGEGTRYEDEWIDNEDGGEIYQHQYCCYKIIIPKEEPKQETLEEAAEIDLTNLCYYDKRNPDCSVDDEDIEGYKKSLLKKNKTCSCDNCFYGRTELTEQLIWQQERMYSEEDLRNAYRWGTTVNHGTKEHFNEWFEQFKKK